MTDPQRAAPPPDPAAPSGPVGGHAAAARGPLRPRFSVVLPTYNRSDIVMEAVASVLNQSYTDLELIIVDDHSTDSTKARLRRISDPRVTIVSNDGSRGGATARNLGISLARGEWICQIDSDDLWDEHMLTYLARGVAAAPPAVGVVYGSDVWLDMDTGDVRRTRIAHLSGPAYPRMLERHFYHHCAAAMRRTALESVGGYDESLAGMEDTDLQHRLTESWEVLAVPQAVYYYRVGRSDQVTNDHETRAVKQRLFLHKYTPLLRTMPKSMVKIAGVVMVTSLRAGHWREAARLWTRVMRWGPAAPVLVWRYHLQSAVIIRDRLRRARETTRRTAVARLEARRTRTVVPKSTHKRTAEPT